jgi:CBS domain-containing protein
MRVEHVMSKRVWTCRPDEPLWSAAKLMWDHDIGAVPVMGADEKVIGVVTDRDLCMAAYFAGKPLAEIPVEHAMSRTVHSVEPAGTLEATAELMRSQQIRRIPVIAGEKLVGLVSLGDIARASRAGHVAPGDVAQTLAAIAEARVGDDAVAT